MNLNELQRLTVEDMEKMTYDEIDKAIKECDKQIEVMEWNGAKSIAPTTYALNQQSLPIIKNKRRMLINLRDSSSQVFGKTSTVQELERLYGQETVTELRKAADQGNVEATRQLATWGLLASQFTLANWYSRGAYGLVVDYRQAIHWYKKAAEQGDAEAMYLLGDFCKNGVPVPGSSNGAVGWYEKAANLGYPIAKIWLGIHYCKGDGVGHNPALGRKLIEEAEYEGAEIDAPTNLHLGVLFSNSLICTDGGRYPSDEDYSKSIRYLEEAVAGFRILGSAFHALLEQADSFLSQTRESKRRLYGS